MLGERVLISRGAQELEAFEEDLRVLRVEERRHPLKEERKVERRAKERLRDGRGLRALLCALLVGKEALAEGGHPRPEEVERGGDGGALRDWPAGLEQWESEEEEEEQVKPEVAKAFGNAFKLFKGGTS